MTKYDDISFARFVEHVLEAAMKQNCSSPGSECQINENFRWLWTQGYKSINITSYSNFLGHTTATATTVMSNMISSVDLRNLQMMSCTLQLSTIWHHCCQSWWPVVATQESKESLLIAWKITWPNSALTQRESCLSCMSLTLSSSDMTQETPYARTRPASNNGKMKIQSH